MKRTFTALMLGSTLAAGGCVNLNYPQSTVEGAATRDNFAAQVVDPSPAEGAPMMDAGKVDEAVDRYRNDEVKQPFSDEGGGLGTRLSVSNSQ